MSNRVAALTLGVEEEFQILHPQTLGLAPAYDDLVACNEADDLEIKSELHQSCCEVVTPPCRSVDALGHAVRSNRRRLFEIAQRAGCRVALAGTHPFAHWNDLPINRDERRLMSEHLFQEAHRQCLAFALHVHVGIPNRTIGLRVMNDARELLPVLYALSCSSPFLEGRQTGLKSSRVLRAFGFPRTGIPDAFENLSQLCEFVTRLEKSGLILDAGQLWWDIRLHHKYPTVEFRVCDAVPKVDDVMAIAALIQVFVANLIKRYENGEKNRSLDRLLLEENRWRAARFGTDVALFDFSTDTIEPLETILTSLCKALEPHAERLGVLDHIERAVEIAERGSAADRQLAMWNGGRAEMTEIVAQYLAETTDI